MQGAVYNFVNNELQNLKSCRLRSGIQLIDKINVADFKIILLRAVEGSNNDLFTPDELKKFEENFGFDEDSVYLVIQSIAYIFKQSCRFILKPTVLEKQLVEDLKFQKDKAQEFVQLWTSEAKRILVISKIGAVWKTFHGS